MANVANNYCVPIFHCVPLHDFIKHNSNINFFLMNSNKQQLLLQLHDVGAIQFGSFTLRSGATSPFYLDFRRLVAYPQLLKAICTELWHLVKDLEFDFLCGVPYAALSFATGVSVAHNVPMVVKRKKRKTHGSKKLVEGVFEHGQSCVVVEDIVTSGISLLETLVALEQEGLRITDAVAIVDRKQGGTDILAQKGYTVHTIFDIYEVFNALLDAGRIDQKMYNQCLHFVRTNITKQLPTVKPLANIAIPNYKARNQYCQHPIAKRLLHIIETKKTNLTLSADVDNSAELLQLADTVGPHICMLKTHVDVLNDFDRSTVFALQQLAKKHNFLLFEDRKFCDIGNTVRKQFMAQLFNIANWADVITVHVVAGASTVISLKNTPYAHNTGLIIIAQMSTSDTLTTDSYIKKAVQIGEAHKDVVIGLVAQQRWSNDMGLLQFTPGVHLAAKGDAHGQTYNTPQVAFHERGTDVIIVGRGIYQANDPVAAAIAYKTAAWQAYQTRLA